MTDDSTTTGPEGQGATTRAYRPLELGERAARRTCPACGDRHAALIDASTGAAQCRACGATFVMMQKPRR